MNEYYQKRELVVCKNTVDIAQYRLEYILTTLMGMDKHKSYNILELGSGIGNSIFYLAKSYPHMNFYGVEINENEINSCKKLVEKENIKNVFVFQGDATSFDVGKQFDFVYSEQVIEHVKNQRGLVNNMIKHLNKSGKFFISTVSYNCPFEFHIKLPFVTWLSKNNAIKFMNLVGLKGKAEYYKNVFPITPKNIQSFNKSSGGKDIEYISHKIPLDKFSKNKVVKMGLYLFNLFFSNHRFLMFHKNFFPWLGMIGSKK